MAKFSYLAHPKLISRPMKRERKAMMNSTEIRKKFLDFFAEKRHAIVPSAPMVVRNDPTLMFTNAGMNQFKDIFLGNRSASSPRVADTQKCLRVSGKHNDLEEVGIDTYHHTMFEMLGNWSFGDYFKEEAIGWAWELLTKIYKIDTNNIYVTVFGGDTADNLDEDTEARNIWAKYMDQSRILSFGKKDNFWEMGETGPCGPCSEIHVDLRPASEKAAIGGDKMVNTGHPQVIEIWNLVFIEFNRMSDGSLVSLPAKHIDTGMGFERLVRVLQGKTSNYDTDIFTPTIAKLESLSGIKYGTSEQTDIAMRVVADHLRAASFAIADGQLPSNIKAGYVIRRILRRAVRYGYTFLKFEQPFICQLVDLLVVQFGEVFPEIKFQAEFIKKVIKEEEASFLRTLETGLRKMELITSNLEGTTIPGDVAFELYDTYGFPFDLTELIAREKGLSVDTDAYEAEMGEQKQRSRKAANLQAGDWVVVADLPDSDFVGYDLLSVRTKVLRYRTVKVKDRNEYQVVLEQTPFYPESGGQVGDTGFLQIDGANDKISIQDTKKENQVIIHVCSENPAKWLDPKKPEVTASVSADWRTANSQNHSATHLLHSALRKVLGDHVAQKGSYVGPDQLRFDFSHYTKLTDDEILRVETMVNQKIRQNIALGELRNVPLDEAKAMGATALFGEKYSDFVRVISFDPSFSMELCGGTHVKATGEIGFFKLISEGSVAAGVRRIEALTARAAEDFVAEKLKLLEQLNELMKFPREPVKNLITLIDDKAKLLKEIERFRLDEIKRSRADLAAKVAKRGEYHVLITATDLPDPEAMRQVAFELRNQFDNLFVVLLANPSKKPLITILCSENLVDKLNLNVARLVKDWGRHIKGGGGGQPFFATAGGKDPDGIDKVLLEAEKYVENVFPR